MPEILHVTTPEDWEQARREGEYRADSLATEGFIHCCLPGQLAGVVSRHYADRRGLLVLRVEPERLRPPVKWECPPGSDETFPHAYGPVNLDAVAGVVPLDEALGRWSRSGPEACL